MKRKILAFFIGNHDSNICFYDGDKFSYVKTERVTGVKHHGCDISFIRDWCTKNNFKPDLIAFTDGNRNNLGICDRNTLFQKVEPIDKSCKIFGCETYCIDHHYAHILSTWPVSEGCVKNANIGITIDGCGDHRTSISVIENPGNIHSAKIKNTMGRGNSIGSWFQSLGQIMGLRVRHPTDYAGKIMGAQSYGTVDEDFIKSTNFSKGIADPLSRQPKYGSLDLFEIVWRGRKLSRHDKEFFNFKNKDFRDWLATSHKIIELYITDIVFKNNICNDDDIILYSGGVAQNVLVNDKLYLKYKNIFIPTHCYDGGLSLGCMYVASEICNQPLELSKINKTMMYPYWQNDVLEESPTDETIKHAAKMIASGKIVGWFQGRGEIGPRALGNRSILMNPGIKDGKDIINRRVKHREHWRPFAPSCLVDDCEKWFKMDKNSSSKYMLRSVLVQEDKKDKIRSVVHNDLTSRIQTVSEEDNPAFYKLLKEFKKLTGIPLLLNTSLNGGGDPIFANVEQCENYVKISDIDVIIYGNRIIKDE